MDISLDRHSEANHTHAAIKRAISKDDRECTHSMTHHPGNLPGLINPQSNLVIPLANEGSAFYANGSDLVQHWTPGDCESQRLQHIASYVLEAVYERNLYSVYALYDDPRYETYKPRCLGSTGSEMSLMAWQMRGCGRP